MAGKEIIFSKQAKGVVRFFSATLNFRMIHNNSRTVIYAEIHPVVK